MPVTSVKIQNYLHLLWIAFVGLFGLALLTSKSALSASATVLILFAFINSEQRALWTKNKKVIFIVCLFPLALVMNLFSIGGVGSALQILKSWPWPLLAAPAYVIFKNDRARKVLIYALGSSLAIACLFSFYLFATYLIYKVDIPFMTSNFRIRSFWDPSRWGFFSGFFVLVLTFVDEQQLKMKYKGMVSVAIALVSVAFVLANTRAPLLALALVFIFVAVFKKNLRKRIGFVILLVALVFATNKTALDRFTSIFAIQVQTTSVTTDQIKAQNITSSDPSNAGRLHMWKVALDFFWQQPLFGTGFESTAKPLREFIESKDASYAELFTKIDFSYNDQHSSYLSTLIQMGAVFFIICWGGILFIFGSACKRYLKYREDNQLLFLAGLTYCFVVFVFYTAFNSYEAILFFALLALISEESKNQLTNK